MWRLYKLCIPGIPRYMNLPPMRFEVMITPPHRTACDLTKQTDLTWCPNQKTKQDCNHFPFIPEKSLLPHLCPQVEPPLYPEHGSQVIQRCLQMHPAPSIAMSKVFGFAVLPSSGQFLCCAKDQGFPKSHAFCISSFFTCALLQSTSARIEHQNKVT